MSNGDSLCDQVLTGHLTDDGVEIGLILVVDEPVVEHSLTLVAEETEDLVLVPHLTRLTLQYTWTSREGKIYGNENCSVFFHLKCMCIIPKKWSCKDEKRGLIKICQRKQKKQQQQQNNTVKQT